MYSTRFLKFNIKTGKNEGYISGDPKDLGGLTICGVSSLIHPVWFAKIYAARNDKDKFESLLKDFYYTKFYYSIYDLIEDEQLAFRLYDFGVNSGVGNSVMVLQLAINLMRESDFVSIDGEFGDNTLKAVNETPGLLKEYLQQIVVFYYTRQTAKTHLLGWLRRLFKRL